MSKRGTEYEFKCRTNSGKIVRIIVRALSRSIANQEFRKELAIRFRGKNYKVISKPTEVTLKDHI